MPLPTATELHLERLARLKRVTGWVTLLVGLPLSLATFAHWLVHDDPLGAAEDPVLDALQVLASPRGGGFGLLVLTASFALWRMLAWRVRELRRVALDPGAAPRPVPWFAHRYGAALVAWHHVVAAVAGAWLVGLVVGDAAPLGGELPGWLARLPESAAADGLAAAERTAWLWLGGAHALLALACALVANYFAAVDPVQAPEARGLAAWLRLATWFCALTAAAKLELAYDLPVDLAFLPPFLEGLTVLLWVEVALRAAAALWARFYDGRPHPGARVYTDAVVPRLLGSGFNPVRSLFDVAAEGFGIDLRGTYALTYMRRALLPIGAALAVGLWVASAFHVVPLHSVGVLERFGRRPAANDGLLEPGLHLLWPWPVDRVRQVEVDRVRTLPVGVERPIAGASMLWTAQHAEEEYRLVLGDGQELLSVNAMLHWRPADPLAYVYSVSNPEEALSDVAGQVLFEHTVDRTLEDVLAGNLAVLAETFESAIREAVEARGLGIEVVDLAVLALHPPRDVAADYQSVVSSQIDAERLVIEAQAYDATELLAAAARAHRVRVEAEGDAVQRVARALGQIDAFRIVAAARSERGAGAVLELVLYLDRLRRALAGTPYSVWDARLEEDGATWWILER